MFSCGIANGISANGFYSRGPSVAGVSTIRLNNLILLWVSVITMLYVEWNILALQALDYIKSISVKIDKAKNQRDLLEKCAATALSSKLVAFRKDFFAKMVVDAVMMLDELLPLSMIGIKKVQGGALEVGF